jgi:hypothetical protein
MIKREEFNTGHCMTEKQTKYREKDQEDWRIVMISGDGKGRGKKFKYCGTIRMLTSKLYF